MSISYFNSYLNKTLYTRLKMEAVKLQIPVREHISNILKAYIENNLIRKEAPKVKNISSSQLNSGGK
jgi:hypothetical protein